MEKVLILLGPTGVGKTGLSLTMAAHLKTEIISADSMQVYRFMDIGTAKPSAEERAAVRHHMIDIVDPWERFSAGQYVKSASAVIDRLVAAGKTPLVVGGTGLYIKAMTRGIFSGPSADWTLRDFLAERESQEPGSLHSYLRTLDPGAASRINATDLRRTVRAIEVCLHGGRSISELHAASTRPLPYEFLKIGITRDRSELYCMIEERVDLMIRQGLIDEVKAVMSRIEAHGGSGYDITKLSSMQAIGYKEIALCLSGEIQVDEAVHLVKKRTKMYAKRQYTWFRKEEGIHWVDVTGIVDPGEMWKKVSPVLDNYPYHFSGISGKAG
jgi:tRNA dimethylallyltransferase